MAVKILFGLLGPVIVWCTEWALSHQRNVLPVQSIQGWIELGTDETK